MVPDTVTSPLHFCERDVKPEGDAGVDVACQVTWPEGDRDILDL